MSLNNEKINLYLLQKILLLTTNKTYGKMK